MAMMAVILMPSLATAQGNVVDIVVLPSSQTVASGNFDVTIQAECNGQEITGVSAFLDFDTTYLEVVSITAGPTLDLGLGNTYDNSAGTINYSAGTFTEPYPTGTFTVATITFNAKAETPLESSTLITLHSVSPRTTDADFGGDSKLNGTTGAEVTITGPIEPVPEVSTVILLGLGLLGLGGTVWLLRRRSQKSMLTS